MKKIMPVICLSLVLVSPVFAAFENNVEVLRKPDIVKLDDEKLINAYEDVLVELEAIKTFHATSGFSVKQYDEYRSLLKYRLDLLMEIHGRNVEIPAQMER